MSFSFDIDGRPEFSVVTVQVPKDEQLNVEASAMAWMSSNMSMKTKMKGGLGRLLTGEDLFINEFVAKGGPGELALSPGTPGDILHRALCGESVYLQNSSYLASSIDVSIDTKWQGLVKGFFSGQGLFLIRASGHGDVWFNSYGSLIEIKDPGEGFVVDTNHIVGFTEGLDYKISKLGNYKSLFFSGEGLVCRFRGRGSIWVQSHKVSAFSWWVRPFRTFKRIKSES